MVLFLPDPTVEEADKTNVGWQNSIPLVKKTFLQSKSMLWDSRGFGD